MRVTNAIAHSHDSAKKVCHQSVRHWQGMSLSIL
ncbi:hypothetical protein MBLL_00751 (plasmid) [Methylobacterium bullatum]|uniref:Uncharacterized protein n=1 Tax=Methylobacterium bullatum TaxID=570505 RepID=A0A679JFR0_9HYPH|nr:hypothetical protein MBLL_00751 [Methylobacterium bullatum]